MNLVSIHFVTLYAQLLSSNKRIKLFHNRVSVGYGVDLSTGVFFFLQSTAFFLLFSQIVTHINRKIPYASKPNRRLTGLFWPESALLEVAESLWPHSNLIQLHQNRVRLDQLILSQLHKAKPSITVLVSWSSHYRLHQEGISALMLLVTRSFDYYY